MSVETLVATPDPSEPTSFVIDGTFYYETATHIYVVFEDGHTIFIPKSKMEVK